MKLILKSALATAAFVGVAAMFPIAVSAATVGVSIGVGVPAPAPAVIVVASPYGPDYVAYDDEYYYDPIYIGGSWYHGPYQWRMRHGVRQFLVNGRWHRNEWRDNSFPTTIVFHNGGRYSGGRYEGFFGAARINARFQHAKPDMRDDRQDRGRDGHHKNEAHEHHDGGNSHN